MQFKEELKRFLKGEKEGNGAATMVRDPTRNEFDITSGHR